MREDCSIIVGVISYIKIIDINCLDSHVVKSMKDVIGVNVHQIVQRTCLFIPTMSYNTIIVAFDNVEVNN